MTLAVTATLRRVEPGPMTMPRAEAWALAYLALPTVIFTAGWIVAPLGPITAAAITLALLALGRRGTSSQEQAIGPLLVPVAAIATLWCVMGGIGHFVYANSDWVVRDAVLLDLVRRPWPVGYTVDGVATVLRAPIGFFLPAALVGKLWGLRAAELALLAWTVAGVMLTFVLMLRDRPSLRAAMIRIGVFVVFSGMDIVGQATHLKPHELGEHLEWWAYLFQYSSQTTQLFWVPNHALPGWLAVAWLLGQDARRLSIAASVLFVAFAPLWSPLTAIGIAPLCAVAIARRLGGDRHRVGLMAAFDWRMLVPALACVLLVYPYIVSGSATISSGATMAVRWVGEDFAPRYLEFVVLEFVGFAGLLLWRDRRDLPTWTAVAVLLALPFYRFGPFNDLAMRASIPALTVLAIRLGHWLSSPRTVGRDTDRRLLAVLLIAIGAVTPLMEFTRPFIQSPWAADTTASVIDVTRGTHYLTPLHQPWLDRFLARPAP